GGVDESPAALANVLRPDLEWTMQRHWPEVFDGHSRGGGRGIEKAVHLAHSLIENGGNDSPVTVPGRSSVSLAQAKLAQELPASFVESKPQAHATRVIAPTTEAEILLGLFARVASSLLSRLVHACSDVTTARSRPSVGQPVCEHSATFLRDPAPAHSWDRIRKAL